MVSLARYKYTQSYSQKECTPELDFLEYSEPTLVLKVSDLVLRSRLEVRS